MTPGDKESYLKSTDIQVKKFRSRITSMEKQIEAKAADIKIRHDQKMHHIRGQYARLNDLLMDMRASTDANWKARKAEMDRTVNELDEALKIMDQRISNGPEG